jgi:hypothetical protein
LQPAIPFHCNAGLPDCIFVLSGSEHLWPIPDTAKHLMLMLSTAVKDKEGGTLRDYG